MWPDVSRAHHSMPRPLLQLWAALQGLSPMLRSGYVVHTEAAAKELYLLWKWNSLFTTSSFCFLTRPDKRARQNAAFCTTALPSRKIQSCISREGIGFWFLVQMEQSCGCNAFVLDLHRCYPERCLALLFLINRRSQHSFMSPVTWGKCQKRGFASNLCR